MLIGVDWGGTKIEAIALDDDGQARPAARADAPVGLRRLPAAHRLLVARVEAETGATGPVGVGLPGSLDPPRDGRRARAPRGSMEAS